MSTTAGKSRYPRHPIETHLKAAQRGFAERPPFRIINSHDRRPVNADTRGGGPPPPGQSAISLRVLGRGPYALVESTTTSLTRKHRYILQCSTRAGKSSPVRATLSSLRVCHFRMVAVQLPCSRCIFLGAAHGCRALTGESLLVVLSA